ncbi:MAG: hypothetical protein ACYDCO_01375 [Armatimonadota bacterium]
MRRLLWIVVSVHLALLALSGCQKAAQSNSAAPSTNTPAAGQGAPVTTMPATTGQPVTTMPATTGQPVTTMPATVGQPDGSGAGQTASPGPASRPFQQYMNSMTPEERKKWDAMSDEERTKKRNEIMSGQR